MSVIQGLNEHHSSSRTTLAGTVESECTYEVVDEGNDSILVLRTTTSDTIHITPEIGKQLIKLIVDNIL